MNLFTIMHHITTDLFKEAYGVLNRAAAPGVDSETWEQYGEQLEARLPDLHRRLHSSELGSDLTIGCLFDGQMPICQV